MNTRLPGVPPSFAPAAVVLLVAAALFCTGALLGQRHPHYQYWLVLAVSLAALAALWFAARKDRAAGIADALRGIAEGGKEWRKAWAAAAASGAVDDELRSAVETLAEAVDSLRVKVKRLERVVASINDGILAFGSGDTIVLANPAAASLLGRRKAQLEGSRIDQADLHPEIIRLVHDCLKSSEEVASEITLPGPDRKVLGLRAARCRAAERKTDCVIIVIQDLTDLRRHERYEREFVSNVTHEIKTPIAAVRSTAETLLTGAKNDPDVVDRFLNTIISESDRLAALIEDIMEIAKIDSGVAATEKAVSNVYDVVERAVNLLRQAAEQRGLELRVDVPKRLAGYFDPSQMVQVVRNLVDNAIKYTLEPGKVEVSARAEDDELVISVSDTGIGIPHGEVDRIFDRFYRVDKARSRRLGGTGLGLAIVKDIVESHGGRVTVESELGRGSVFTVRLPGRGVAVSKKPRSRR